MINLPIKHPPTDDDVVRLEGLCKWFSEAREDFASPWVVEFAGLPRAGKSGCIAVIQHLFRRNGISVLAPDEGARQAPEHLKDDLVAYNAWTATYAIQQILEGTVRSGDPRHRSDVVILDRGPFDATAWLHLFEKQGKFEKTYRECWTEFLRLPKWANLVRQVFFFHCSADTSVERELRGKLSRKHGTVLSKPVLEELRAAYTKACDCYATDFDIAAVDTDGKQPDAIALAVADHLLAGIQKAHQEITGDTK